MPIFEYICFDAAGKETKGVITADSAKAARDELRREDLFPYELKVVEKNALSIRNTWKFMSRRINPQTVAMFTRQLATLIYAGIPLLEALTALVEQEEVESVKKVLLDLKEKVREGKALSESLALYPEVFSGFYINMVSVGEESGTLNLVLVRLADHLEEDLRLKNKVKTALAYPLFMTVIGASVITFLTIYVVPKVTDVFQNYQQALPLPTVVLLSISSFMTQYWYLLFLFLALFIMAVKYSISTKAGKERFDAFLLKTPVLGKIFSNIAIAEFAQTLGILLSSGIPLLKAMEIVAKTVDNCTYEKTISQVRASIREGHSIAAPLRKSKLFPAVVTQMIAVGERSGNLPDMLGKIAESYNRFVENSFEKITSLIEPVVILVMGVFVGFIVISILFPIFEMSQLVK